MNLSYALILLCLLVGGSAHALSASAPKIDAAFSIYGNSVESDTISGINTGSSIDGFISQKLSEDLEYALRGGVVFETGSNKALNIDEFAPKQAPYLYESYVKASFLESLSIKIGALNQQSYNSELLLADVPFAGAKEEAKFEAGNFRFLISAQQAVPNNQDLNQRLGSVQEGTPSFMIETLGLGYVGESVLFDLQVSHFQYQDISSSVAQDSRFLGNSVSGVNQNAKFSYGYEGINVASDFALNIGSDKVLKIKGQYLFNNEAPDGRNTGYLYGAALRMNSVELGALRFKNESDSSVAYYNDKWLGHNNRDGYGVSVKYLIPKQNTEIEFNFISADLLSSNSGQAGQEAAVLSLTRKYDVN